MQTRYLPTNLGLHLTFRLTIWQQIIFWSSLLASHPAWAVPKTTASPTVPSTPAAHTRPIADPVTIAALSPLPHEPEVHDPEQQAATPPFHSRLKRHPAAALLPLQPLQSAMPSAIATSNQEAAFITPWSETRLAAIPASGSFSGLLVVDIPAAAAIAQNSSPPATPGSNQRSPVSDPELGVLRLQVSPLNAEAGSRLGQNQTEPPRPKCPSGVEADPELGCLPLQLRQPLPPPRQPVVYLLGHVDYFRSSNVFSAVDPVDDGLIRPGLTLFTAPALGRNTYFVGSIDVNFIRYKTQSQIDYNELKFRAGIFQRLSPTMFGEFGWSNQQLFIARNKIPGLPVGTRFLNDHAIRLELSRRDQLNKRLALSTFYQLRFSFADPDSRSRLLNSLIASLSYDLQPNLQVGIDYQFALANFTSIRRDDQYHQLAARLTYTAFRNTQLNVFVGYSFGRSSDPTIDFNSVILGVSLTVNIGLF